MKNLLLIALIATTSNFYSQKQYLNVSVDIRNAIIGSNPSNNKPSLDIIILGGVTDKNGITLEAGYENFKAIKFSKIYFGIGYTFVHWSKKLECAVTLEPTYITRDWGDDYGKVTYKSIGASSRVTYNVNDNFGVSLLGNVLLRTDNEDRYGISTPKVFSAYLGITYSFNQK